MEHHSHLCDHGKLRQSLKEAYAAAKDACSLAREAYSRAKHLPKCDCYTRTPSKRKSSDDDLDDLQEYREYFQPSSRKVQENRIARRTVLVLEDIKLLLSQIIRLKLSKERRGKFTLNERNEIVDGMMLHMDKCDECFLKMEDQVMLVFDNFDGLYVIIGKMFESKIPEMYKVFVRSFLKAATQILDHMNKEILK